MFIAIMGTGMVGGALARYFASVGRTDIGLYDPPKGLTDVNVLASSSVVFVVVPTPYYLDGSGFDDSFMRAALDAIPGSGKIVVLKSTILPGTTDALQAMYPQHHLLFNPEFLTEATADEDMRHPKRQIVGYTQTSKQDAQTVLDLLPSAPFQTVMPANAAEMVKYFGNAFYALKVAYANQMYDLCQAMGIDYGLVQACATAEPMIVGDPTNTHLTIFHKGYRGYGGKCLPKDTRSIIQLAHRAGVDLTLLKEAEAYNNALTHDQGLNIQWEEGSPTKPGTAS